MSDGQQLDLIDPDAGGAETPRGREPAEVYDAAVALRERGFAVRRAGRLHDVDGDLLDDAGLLRLAAYWSKRRGLSRGVMLRSFLADERESAWQAKRDEWLSRPPVPRGQTLTRRRPYRTRGNVNADPQGTAGTLSA